MGDWLPVDDRTRRVAFAGADSELVKISLLLPTRGRPELVERFFKSVINTAEHLDAIEVVLCIDDDDVGSHHLHGGSLSTVRLIGPRRSMGAYNTQCYQASTGQIIVLVNDDMVMRTVGWDRELRVMHGRFPDQIYLGYCNDLLKKKGLATFPVLSRKTCELLGDPYPDAYAGAFIDVHLFDIFKRLQYRGFDRFIYFEHVVFEHLHYRTGKAVYDETYKRRGRFEDDLIFIRLSGARREAARNVLNFLKGQHSCLSSLRAECEAKPIAGKSSLLFYCQQIFLDHDLPLRWRTYLWFWFTLRHSAAHGVLRYLIKGTHSQEIVADSVRDKAI